LHTFDRVIVAVANNPQKAHMFTMEERIVQAKETLAGLTGMGLAPLANMDDPDLKRHPRLTRLMRYAYEHVEETYDFKHLYRYKAKYHPHAWERRYLCFLGRRLSPRILFATLQVRDAFSIRELLSQQQFGVETKNARLGFSRKVESWKHGASFVIGVCSALLFSS
jgi:hypothetical protein